MVEDKFKKRTNCEYCGGEMKATYRNKKFCSDKCRTYFNRENPKSVVQDLTKTNKKVKNLSDPPPQTNVAIDNTPKENFKLGSWMQEQRKKKLGF